MPRARSIVMSALSVGFGVWLGICPALAASPRIAVRETGTRQIVSPVFGDTLQFSMPAAFDLIGKESPNSRTITRQAVPRGETLEHWTENIELTAYSSFDLLPLPQPVEYAIGIASDYRSRCPASFGESKIEQNGSGGQEIFVSILGCGRIAGQAYGETTLLVMLRAGRQNYRIAWSIRTPSAARPALDSSNWPQRLRLLRPITVCPPDRDASPSDCSIRY